MRTLLFIISILTVFFNITAAEMEFNIDINDTNALPSALIKAVNQAYDLNKRGLDFLDKKDLDGAMKSFDGAIAVLPDYDDALNNKGVVYFRKGLISDAQEIWKTIALKKPDYSIALYNLGLIDIHEKKYDTALRLFEKALKSNKSFVEALVRYGYLQMQIGNKEKGFESLKKAYKISPEHQEVWSFFVHGLILNGDTLEAISILKKKEPQVEALKLHGILEASRKNYAIAIDLLSKAVNKGAEAGILIELASVQVENDNCKSALATMKKYFLLNIPYEADAWLIAGIAAKDCNNLSLSEQYFEQGVSNFPNDAILRYNLGQIYFHLNKCDKAEEVWSGLTDTLQDPSLYYLRAMNAKRKQRLNDAEKFVKKAISIDEKAEYDDFLGVLYHLKGDDNAAAEQFKKALKINPDLKSAQLDLALVSRTGESLNAITFLEQQLKSCSNDSCADLALKLSVVYYHSKMTDKAIQVLLSIKENDKNETAYRHLAIYYKDLHEWNKAIAALETAAKKLVLEPQTEYELAESYLFAGMYQKAIDRFTSLIPKWGQNSWRLYYQIGYAYLEQNELNKAKEYFEKSLKTKPDNVAARGLLAFVENRLGNVSGARQLWEKNLKDDPNNASLWINMGLSFERDGKFTEALEYYKKAAMLKNDLELQINIGNVFMGLEKYTDALEAYNQALSSPKRELAAYNIFLVARKKKDRDRADKMKSILEKEFPSSTLTKRMISEMSLWNSDTIKAITILESINDKDQSDYLTLAMLYALKKNKDKANYYLGKVSEDVQYQKAVDNVKAQLAFVDGNYEQALQIMKATGDTSFVTKYNIALSAYNAKQFNYAFEMANKLSNTVSGTDKADVCRLAGNSAFALKQWNAAKQWYLQLSNMEAANPIVQYNLAIAFYNLDEIDNAWKYYQHAKSLDAALFNKDIEAKYNSLQSKINDAVVTDSTDLWYNKAVELQGASDDSTAEKFYKKVVEKDSLYSLAWNNLGAIYGKRGCIDNAEKAYFKAVEKKHDIPESYANLVNLYIELEEFTKARQWILKGIGHNPDSQLLKEIKEKINAAEKAKLQKHGR